MGAGAAAAAVPSSARGNSSSPVSVASPVHRFVVGAKVEATAANTWLPGARPTTTSHSAGTSSSSSPSGSEPRAARPGFRLRPSHRPVLLGDQFLTQILCFCKVLYGFGSKRGVGIGPQLAGPPASPPPSKKRFLESEAIKNLFCIRESCSFKSFFIQILPAQKQSGKLIMKKIPARNRHFE